MAEKKESSKQDLLERLTPEQYRITQEAGLFPHMRVDVSSGQRVDAGEGFIQQ